MVEPYTLGFINLHGSGDYNFVMISNYGKAGFWLRYWKPVGAINALGFRGSPDLGLAHDGFVICLVISRFCFVST